MLAISFFVFFGDTKARHLNVETTIIHANEQITVIGDWNTCERLELTIIDRLAVRVRCDPGATPTPPASPISPLSTPHVLEK